MSDKDHFTFEDDDDFPETNLGDKNEPQESELADEGFSEVNLDAQDDQDEYQGLDLNHDEDFPETDLSAAFAEGEHSADESDLDELEQKTKGGSSKTRALLMVLLLVIAVGGGAYYFMGLGGSTPSVPTVPVPAQKATKSVALPPQSAKAPVAPAKVEPAAKPVSVAVPPPPPPEPVAKANQVKQPVAVATAQAPPVAKAEGNVVADKPKEEPTKQPATAVAASAPQPKVVAKPTPAPAPQKVVATIPPAPEVVAPAKSVEAPKQTVGGAFTLDVGSYLLESNRDSLVAKIKKLGYEPLVTPIDATLDMTRLRLGTFSKDEVQDALAFARTIEPGAYSSPAGDRYVLYAGTFLQSSNVDRLSRRFLEEGIKVHPEPVQVVRTLNRIRFGSFATKEEATAVAREISQSGLKAEVVKFKK